MLRLPEYMRPQLTKLDVTDKQKLEEVLGRSEKVASNIWLTETRKRYGSRGYRSEVVIKNGKDYYQATFPTDAKGFIPPTAMAERIMDLADGDRNHRERNIFIDVAVTAKNINSPKDKAKSYLWFLYPNEGDIKGIDDVNTKIVTILPKSSKKQKRSILLMGGTEKQRELVAKVIDDNFTLREKKLLVGVLYTIKPIRGAAGTYQRARILGEGGGVSLITLDPKYLNDLHGSSLTIHEAIHALRDHDTKRLSGLRRRGLSLVGRDSDLEESMTEAETTTRENPLKTHDSASTGFGYYGRLDTPGKTKREAVVDDRVTITEPKKDEDYLTSGKRGVKAQRHLLKHYPETNISKLKLRGAVEAIDTYYKTVDRSGRVVNMQAYSPRAKEPEPPRGEVKTIEFKDGRGIKISGRAKLPKRKIPGITPKTPKLRR